jgi:two-component system cell cycle sensor histidine kinase/response regulator CckA
MGLRSKFMVSLVLLSAGLSIASLYVVRNRVGNHVREELLGALHNSAATFQEVQLAKDATAQTSAQLFANVPALKAMMTTADPPTIQDASTDIWRRAGTGLLALAAPSGKLLALHNAGAAVPAAEVESSFARSLSPFRTRDWWLIGDRLYEVFLERIQAGPVSDSTLLGYIAVGIPIDESLAEQVARIAEGQVAFRYGDRQVVTTFRDTQARELAALKIPDIPTGAGFDAEIAGEHYLATVVRLAETPDGPVDVLMLKSYDQATAFLSTLDRLSIGIAVMAVILSMVFVFFISHTFTRPLADLVIGVRELGKGDFDYPLNTTGTDEVAEVTRAFDKMRHSLQESQNRMVNAARMEAIGQLAGGIAHDFNNLITIIKGYTELLLVHSGDVEPVSGYVQQIQKAGDRASSVTRQLLAFSRRQLIQPQVVDMSAVVANMMKMLRVMIGEDVEVKVVSESDLRRVLVDPGQIEQVLLNLGVNARDAMPKGGKLIIETTNVDIARDDIPAGFTGVQPGRFVRLAVTDTGCGMPADLITKIFQPFFTTKAVGKGTGLGLAIVYGIVKQCGGFISVVSEVGKGTTFEVCFPETLQKPELKMCGVPAWKLDGRGRGTVLLVEDEQALRAMARDALRLQGYSVLEAPDGEQGITVFERFGARVDLVVTDIVMPQLGGLDMVDRMRKIQPDIKVLFMSGYSDRIDEITNTNLAFVPKPFTPDQLLKAIREILPLENSGSPLTAQSPAT